MASAAEAPLEACLRFLFPNSTPPRISSYARSAELSWLPLPNPRSPRILVPTSPARATGRAVVRISTALNRQERVVRRIAGQAMSLGAGFAYPGRLSLDEVGEDSILDYLAARFEEPVTVAISVGPARGNLKIVLAVYSLTGTPLAFVKVGYPDAAVPHVLRETQSFQVLETKSFTRLDVPRLLFADTWRGYPVLAITPLRDPGHQVRDTLDRLPLSAMSELGNAFAEEPAPLAELRGWQRLRTQAATGPTSERFCRLMEVLHERYGGEVVRPTAWHGDWTPWNMAWGRDRITLWDWERFEQGVPAGFDAYHYAIFAISGTTGFTRKSIADGLQRVHNVVRPGLPPHDMLAQLYLATLLGRHLEAAGQFAPVSDRMVELLQAALEESLSVHAGAER